MEQRKAITCCATTSHNGYVMEGYATMRSKGHRIAGKGHRVYCPTCNGIYPIDDSLRSMLGYAPAVDGMRAACGAVLLASPDAPLPSRRYLHQSAHWTLGEFWTPQYQALVAPDAPTVATLPRPALGPELLFPMRPASRRERLVFDQRSGH